MSESTRKIAYTVKEAAMLLSLSRSKVYELIHAKQIETFKIGRSRRISADQLHRFIQTMTEAGG